MLFTLAVSALVPMTSVGFVVYEDHEDRTPTVIQVENIARDILRSREGVELASSHLVAGRQVADRRAEAEASFKQGKVAYFELEPDKATRSLKAASDGFLAIADVNGRKDAVRALALRASVLVEMGDTKAAESVLEELLFTAPDGEWISADGVSEGAVTLAGELRQRIEELADGTLSFSTGGAPASVFVDGLFRGVTPVHVSVKPGAHSYILVRDGYDRRSGHVRVGEGKEKRVDLTLKPTPTRKLVLGFQNALVSDLVGATEAHSGVRAALGGPEELLVVVVGRTSESAPTIIRIARVFPDAPPLLTEMVDPVDTARIQALLSSELGALLDAPKPEVPRVVVDAPEPEDATWVTTVAVGAGLGTSGLLVGFLGGVVVGIVTVVALNQEPARASTGDPYVAARRHVVLGL